MRTEPDPTDVHVGRRIRAQRFTMGISQQSLADAIGVSFQQVQKYEKGANRVAPSRLQAIANFLTTEPAFFYQLGPAAGVSTVDVRECDLITRMLATAGGAKLAAAFVSIATPGARQALVTLAQTLAGVEPDHTSDAQAA